jgi:hypothetical protein
LGKASGAYGMSGRVVFDMQRDPLLWICNQE